MHLVDAVDYYYSNFTSAVAQVRVALTTCQDLPNRDQGALADIASELDRLHATAEGRDLVFWQGDQGTALHVALGQLHERIVREAHQGATD